MVKKIHQPYKNLLLVIGFTMIATLFITANDPDYFMGSIVYFLLAIFVAFIYLNDKKIL